MSKSRSTEQTGSAVGGPSANRWGRPVMMTATVLLAVGMLFGGCTQEAWQRENWTLNPFKKDKTTSPDAGSKARRPSNSTTASRTPAKSNANSSNAKTAAKPAESSDPKAEQVNRDVEAYAQRFPAKGQSGSTQTNSSSTGSTANGPGARPSTTARTTAKPSTGAGSDGTANAGSSRPAAGSSSTPVATRTNKPARPVVEDNGGELMLIGSTPATGQPIADSTPNSSNIGGNPATNNGSDQSAIPATTSDNSPTHASTGSMTPSGTVTNGNSGGSSNASGGTASTSAQPIAPTDKPTIPVSDNTTTPTNDERPPVIGSIRIEAGSETDVVDTDPQASIDSKSSKPAAIEPNRESSKPAKIDAVKPITTEPKTDTVADAAKPVPATPIQPKISEPVKSPVIESSKPIPAETPSHSASANTSPASNSPLAGLEGAVAQDPNNIDKQLKLRMAYLLNDDEDRAMAPTPGMSEDTQKVVLAQIKAMISAKGATGRDAASAAQAQLASAEAIRTAAKDKADLQVPRVVLCTSIRRFGDYTPITPLIFPAGKKNQALLYIEVENYQSRKTSDGQFEVLLSMRESLLDAKGKELWAFQTPKIQDISRQQREDFFLSTQPRTIPPGLPAGEYAYKVEVEDLVAGKINSNLTKFKLVATQPN